VKRLPASWANGKGGLAEAERKARAFHGTGRVILARIAYVPGRPARILLGAGFLRG